MNSLDPPQLEIARILFGLPAARDFALAVDSPPLFPIESVDGIPVLAPQDLAARKVLAIVDRSEGRDFTDLRILVDHFGRTDCIRWAQQLDSGVTPTAIADAFDQLDRLDDNELPVSHPSAVRSDFANWASDLRDIPTGA